MPSWLMTAYITSHHPPPPCVTRPRCHGLCHHATQHTIDCMVFISNVANRFRMISYHNVSGVTQVICIRVKNREGIGFPLKHTSEIWSQHIVYIPVWIINFVQNWNFPNRLLHKKQKKRTVVPYVTWVWHWFFQILNRGNRASLRHEIEKGLRAV